MGQVLPKWHILEAAARSKRNQRDLHRTSSNKLDRRALADMASKLVQDPQRVLGTSAVEEAVNTLLEARFGQAYMNQRQ